MAENQDVIVVRLTSAQAEFLLALLDGFVCRESIRMSDQIIRRTRQVGQRVADAAGQRWIHGAR